MQRLFFVDPTTPVTADLVIKTDVCIACGEKPRVSNQVCADCLADYDRANVWTVQAGAAHRIEAA